jgi:fluoride ion exporter CrcB/FEX
MLDNLLIAGAVLGLLGGAVRAIVGAWNAHHRRVKFDAGYFCITLVVALLIGIGLAIALDGTTYVKLIAFLGGYGGSDFLEGLIYAAKILPQKK